MRGDLHMDLPRMILFLVIMLIVATLIIATYVLKINFLEEIILSRLAPFIGLLI